MIKKSSGETGTKKPGPRSAGASGAKAGGAKAGGAKAGGAKAGGAKASGQDRPRIKATHSEAGPEKKRPGKTVTRSRAASSETDLEKRRTRARATVKALAVSGRSPATKRSTSSRTAAPLQDRPATPTARRRASSPPPAVGPSAAARELAIWIAAAGLEKKAMGIEVIDVSGRVDYADFLVIMTGTSDRHVHALAMGIEESLRRRKLSALSVEGLANSSWVLMDFEDVVVHLFQEETRSLYDIEGLWVDAARLPVSEKELAKA